MLRHPHFLIGTHRQTDGREEEEEEEEEEASREREPRGCNTLICT